MKRTPLKAKKPLRSKPRKVPAEIKEHWGRVARLGCCVSFADEATIHHVHGGSIAAYFGAIGKPGVGQKQNDWLVIPLAPRLHTGQEGIDNGMGTTVEKWEQKYGAQLEYLKKVRDQIKKRYGYDIFERAGVSGSD